MNKSILDIAAEDRFKLTENFLKEFEGKQPEWGPVGYVTYLRTYSRLKEDGKREEFWETCKRVVEGVYTIQRAHCRKVHLPWNGQKAQHSAQEMFRLMWEMKFLPPGRGLWSMGADIVYEKGGACLNNCAFVSTNELDVNFADPFVFMMDMSMMGAGVGFDVKGAGVAIKEVAPGTKFEYIWTVGDSREGWCDALRAALEAYSKGGVYPKFVYKAIRKKGTPIKGFGGTSSGPDPLARLLDEDVPEILDRYVGKELDAEGIADLFNAIGRCVVAGNVRRSAQIALGPATEEFIGLKDPEHERLNKWGWASNNSVVLNGGSVSERAIHATQVNGEPGYFWLRNAQRYGRMGWGEPEQPLDGRVVGTNPCSEQSLESFEMCCLVETFPARHESFSEYQKTLKYAYLYAKTVTLVPTHFPKTNAVMMRNRRIGTSMSGIIQAMNKFGRKAFLEEWCDGGYKYLRELDAVYSGWLCVPTSVKVTSVKPSGTVSLLCGATPGIHHPHSRWYLRRIRFQKGTELVDRLEEMGYDVEQDVVDSSAVVVAFPVEERHFSKGKSDVSMWEQLELAAAMQHWWADNQVSVTVTFREGEGEDLEHALELYSSRLKSVSFLPLVEHGFEQAPYEAIDGKMFKRLSSKLKKNFGEVGEVESERGGSGCDGEICTI